ncbi:MAG: hypothetical protein CL920_26850 [Deltaproteobacteria bacterium]|nr:hypothetical protein [Deltaproteobacteria bacterium]|tara:strand:+ start:11756 stop:12316 length:561 start_codon:yes stop_codon:yes gene_type:complete
MRVRSEIDLATLVRAQRNEAAACRALVATYEKAVFSLLWRMLNPKGKQERVEDLAQETFLRVFRSLKTFRVDGSARLSTWILTIATRLALNELRKRERWEWFRGDVHEFIAPEQADEMTRQRALAVALEKAIHSLKPEFRAVFLLAEYHELSHQEIAEALSIRKGTVKSRLSRAREQINKQIQEFL